MAYATTNGAGPSRAHSIDLDPSDHANIRLRFLVPNPNDPIAVSRRLADSIHDLQSCRRSSSDRDSYLVRIDQLDDLYLLAQQNLRNASSSGFAAIESQLMELSTKISDVQQAVRGNRSWSRVESLPPANVNLPNYAPLVPLSETPPSTSYSNRERPPYGIVTSDGRVYGIMEDQRRMWGYSGGPTWPRDYDHSRPSAAPPPAELPPRLPVGRRSSRAEDASGDPHVSPADGHSTASSAFDVRPLSARRSPPPLTHAGSSSSASTRLDGHHSKPQRPPPAPSLALNNAHTTPSSTVVTDISSKAPSISFLVNHTQNPAPRVVSRDSRTPPSGHSQSTNSIPRVDDIEYPMDVDRRRPHDVYDGPGPYSTPTNAKSGKSSKSDPSAKRRIRNGACTFCREKKLACRPGPMADDPTAANPPACDQCYRRQRTCQHDPEHRRRRRLVMAPRKTAPATSEEPRSGPPFPFDVDGEDSAVRMESEDPSILAESAHVAVNPALVKDEEVDQLETDWMQPD